MIRLLIVEDSNVVREFLVHVLSSDPQIEVIATARDGEEALELVARHRPDVITMDIHMPKLDGLETTRRIMETHPVPIVVVSGSTDPHEVATTFHAMEAGALAVLPRPMGLDHPDHEETARKLVQTVKLMSEVKLVRRWPRSRTDSGASQRPEPIPRRATATEVRVVAIGASTGGPPVVHAILSALPKSFPLPILVVQHMAAGFTLGFAQWLAQSSSLPVHIATQGETIRGGHVYVAPDEVQMRVEHGGRISLSPEASENGLRPSVSCLFRSLAQVYGGAVVAGLLSGMGRDGADELKLLREKGAMTFAQDHESSIVHGMPGEAIRLDAARMILPAGKVAGMLRSLVNE